MGVPDQMSIVEGRLSTVWPVLLSNSLFLRPVHDQVRSHKRRHDVPDLLPRPAKGVEDGVVVGIGHGPLSVGGQGIGDDALVLGKTDALVAPAVDGATASVRYTRQEKIEC